MNVVRGVCKNERGYKPWLGRMVYKYRSDKQNCLFLCFFFKKRRYSVYTRTKQSLIHHYAFKVLFSLPDQGHVSYCHHLASVRKHFNLLLENHWSKWDQTWQECSFAWSNQVLLLSLRSVIQHGCQGPQKPLISWNFKDWKSKMAASGGHNLT